ncbi:hypothetical protein Tco_1293644 [Tanacetum coccineum]
MKHRHFLNPARSLIFQRGIPRTRLDQLVITLASGDIGQGFDPPSFQGDGSCYASTNHDSSHPSYKEATTTTHIGDKNIPSEGTSSAACSDSGSHSRSFNDTNYEEVPQVSLIRSTSKYLTFKTE